MWPWKTGRKLDGSGKRSQPPQPPQTRSKREQAVFDRLDRIRQNRRVNSSRHPHKAKKTRILVPFFVAALLIGLVLYRSEVNSWLLNQQNENRSDQSVFSSIHADWTQYNCTHIADEYYDGDSFMAQTDTGKRIVFRLYFVDTPEMDDRFKERNKQQEAYFGMPDIKPLGKQARRFTRDFLKNGFTATTRHQHAAGMSGLPRSYAFIEVNGQLLSESLLKNGLARPFGKATTLPDGTDKTHHWDRLNRLTNPSNLGNR